MTLLDRLDNHIAQMAIHQKGREQGKLVIEARNEIATLRDYLQGIRRVIEMALKENENEL